jgi:hypothetical protein
MTKLSELRGLLRPDQVAQEPSVEDLFRAWRLNRWPGGLPKSPDWGDVETAFRAGLFQGDAYAHFSAASGPQAQAPEARREFTGGSERCGNCGKDYLDHYGKFCDAPGVQKDGGTSNG